MPRTFDMWVARLAMILYTHLPYWRLLSCLVACGFAASWKWVGLGGVDERRTDRVPELD